MWHVKASMKVSFMTRVMTAGFEAITSTRVYGMHPKLCGVVVRGEQSSCIMMQATTSSMAEYGHVLVQAQLQLLSNRQK